MTRRSEGLYTYNEKTFSGRGILRCLVCREPYRDHPLTRPCKELGGGRIVSDRRGRDASMVKTDAEKEHHAAEKAEALALRPQGMDHR